MPTYKLYYFPAMARAETIRWLFEIGGIQYEDIRIAGDQWLEFKPKTPFGQMPVLEVDGEMLAQSNSIARFVAKRAGLVGKTDMEEARVNMIVDCIEDTVKHVANVHHATGDVKEELKNKWNEEQKPTSLGQFERFLEKNKTGYFVGDSMTLADVFMANALVFMPYVGDVDLDPYPRVKALQEKVTSHPKVADWIKRRPVTEH